LTIRQWFAFLGLPVHARTLTHVSATG